MTFGNCLIDKMDFLAWIPNLVWVDAQDKEGVQ